MNHTNTVPIVQCQTKGSIFHTVIIMKSFRRSDRLYIKMKQS